MIIDMILIYWYLKYLEIEPPTRNPPASNDISTRCLIKVNRKMWGQIIVFYVLPMLIVVVGRGRGYFCINFYGSWKIWWK